MPSFGDPEVQATHPHCPSAEQFEATSVFPLIHVLKEDVITNIDSSLSWEQLTASDINFTIIRPLVYKYARLKNLAIVHVCLLVRAQFLRLSEQTLAHANLNNSRAMMCEILAIKFLRYFASNKIELVAVVSHSWNALAGAPHQVVEEIKNLMGSKDSDLDETTSALEMAISTDSKKFLASPLVQSVVNDIYSGRVVFSTVSHHSVIADNYKQRQIEIYDFVRAPFLDHYRNEILLCYIHNYRDLISVVNIYRLRVPKYGVILEMANFACLLIFFMLCLANKELDRVTVYERIFCVFALAFALEEYTASQEHGWRIYMANTWNVFDTSFIAVWFIYLAFRIKGLTQNDVWSNEVSFDVLACGACILFPRLAFFAVSNSVVILALRAMMADFFYFLAIAVICFSGLLFTLWELSQLEVGNTWTLTSIAWLMTQIWFGNTSLSFAQAASFHPVFGPILMLTFAALSNTLLLTILISILSNTFARIDTNATEEHLFQFTISTIEGVKSDALFSYQPPFNLLAYVILAPLSCFVSPRTLHSANVFLIRITSFPILIIIAIYERYIVSFQERSPNATQKVADSISRKVKKVPLLEALVGSSSTDLYGALFEVEVPPIDVFGEPEEEEVDHTRSRESLHTPSVPRLRLYSAPTSPNLRSRSRSRDSQQGQTSPLARVFVRRPLSEVPGGGIASEESMEGALEGLRRVEKTLKEMKLREEMRELQERQARIESLLMTLTRGMRGETTVSRGGTR